MFVLRNSQKFTASGTANQVAVGDFSGDGLCDLIITTFSVPLQNVAHPVLVFQNTGQGFQDITATMNNPVVSVHARQILVADLNNDHKMDFYIAGHGYDAKPWPGEQSALLLSSNTIVNATSSLVQQISYNHSAALADINQDGKIDILSGNTYVDGAYVNINTIKGFEKLGLPLLRSQTYVFLDANQDGVLDLYAGKSMAQNATILLGNGKGDFKNSDIKIPQAPTGWEDMDSQAIDLNQDGLMDLLVSSYRSDNFTGIYTRALIQTSNGNWIDRTSEYVPYNNVNSSSWRERLILKDLNGDGLTDAVVQYAGQDPNGPSPEIWINTGSGFKSNTLDKNLNVYSRVAVGDLDHNGTPDIVVVKGNTILSYINDAENKTIIGTNLNDKITGDGFGNVITALEGNDTIYADGPDTIDGGLGLDTVVLKFNHYDFKILDGNLSISDGYQNTVLKSIEQIVIGDKIIQVPELFRGDHQPVWRLYDARSQTHHYSGSTEKTLTQMSNGMIFEGLAFEYEKDAKEVYQLTNPTTHQVFYTLDVREKTNLVNQSWVLDSSDFSAYDHKVPNSHEVWRFYNKESQNHLYTDSVNEKTQTLGNSHYVYEGVAYWVL